MIAARRKKELLQESRAKLTIDKTELAKQSMKLDYSGLGMSSLPSIVFKDTMLIRIHILWLNQNDFEALPPEIGLLQELTQLRCFQNHLRFLPPEIGLLGKLQILWLQVCPQPDPPRRLCKRIRPSCIHLRGSSNRPSANALESAIQQLICSSADSRCKRS